MPLIEEFPRLLIPDCLGDLIDQFLVGGLRDNPKRVDADRGNRLGISIDIRRDGVTAKKFILREKLLDRLSDKRQNLRVRFSEC